MVARVQGTASGRLTAGNPTFAGTVTPGNLVTLGLWTRDVAPSLTGFSTAEAVSFPFGFRTHYVGLYYRVAQSGDGTTFSIGLPSAEERAWELSEWSGATTLDVSDIALGIGGTPTVTLNPTATGTSVIYGMAISNNGNFPTDGPIAAGTTYTLLDSEDIDKGVFGWEYKLAIPPGTATVNFTTTIGYDYSGNDSYWRAIGAVFAGTVTPPAPGSAGIIIDPGNDTLLSGTAISEFIMSWTITRGASAEITGGAQPGFASILIANPSDDRFNPENSSSPLYTALRDGTPIWIGVNEDGKISGTAVKGLFGGRLKDITPLVEPGQPWPYRVELTAEDALGWLARTPVRLGPSANRSHQQIRSAVLSAAGEQNTDLAPEISTVPVSSGDGFALSILEQLNQATGTRHFAKPGTAASDWYTYTSRDRHWGLSGTATASLSGTAEHVTSTSGWRKSADTVINQQRVAYTPVTFTPQQTTVWQPDAMPLQLIGTRDIWVEFDDYVAAPSVNLAYSGSTVTSSITPFGDTAKLTLTSAGTSTITTLAVEGALARRAPTESYVANNTTSQATPRDVRAGSDISGDFVGVLASARGMAEHVVWRYGNQQVRPTLTVENWFPDMFELDLFDVISFTSTQLGVTNRLFEIVGLTHQGNRAAPGAIHHTATYVLQECRVQSATNWFQTNVHAPNGSAILGY